MFDSHSLLECCIIYFTLSGNFFMTLSLLVVHVLPRIIQMFSFLFAWFLFFFRTRMRSTKHEKETYVWRMESLHLNVMETFPQVTSVRPFIHSSYPPTPVALPHHSRVVHFWFRFSCKWDVVVIYSDVF